MADHFITSLVIVFCGAAFIATLALWLRQALIIAYICLGALVGPYGLALIPDSELIHEIAEIGIIFLLFLVGLNLPAKKVMAIFGETLVITVVASLCFAAVGFFCAKLIGATFIEAAIVGVACTFSSTIIGIKLLPTTVLHHRRTGEIIISILLLQDLLAIIVLLALDRDADSSVITTFLALPATLALAAAGERFVIRPLLVRFDRIQEYVFVLVLGWSLGIAHLAHILGLSLETGAFIAGVALATHPVSQVIAEQLKPLRDFFLVLFFFAVGASFDLIGARSVLIPGFILGVLLIILKPVVYRLLLINNAQSEERSWEVGARLGQLSEFSLLIIVIALDKAIIREHIAWLVQFATVITMMISAFWIVRTYPTPVALSKKLRRD